MNQSRITIPTTELRRFYGFLKLFNSKTILEISKDINKSKNKQNKFIKMINDSYKHFSKFNNQYEEFLPFANKRKPLPSVTSNKKYKNTEEVIKELEGSKHNLRISYIEREIDPRRSTLAKFDYGKSGRSSGTGGIDFLGCENILDKPVNGEIKTKGDGNAFYSLIQLLNYFTELSTPNQILRCNKYNLFQANLKQNQKFVLIVLFSDFNHNSKRQKDILNETIILSKYILKNYTQIEKIEFLNMTKPFKNFAVL